MSGLITLRGVSAYTAKLEIDEAVEAIFAASPKLAAIAPSARVLLKPNLLAKHAPGACVTTHPAVLRAVVQALKRRGAAKITLADSSAGPYAARIMEAIYEVSGLATVCQEEGVQLHTGTAYGPTPSKGRLVQSFNLIEPVRKADILINLPKMKTHMLTRMSCGVKNLFGTIPGLQKAELHLRFPDVKRFAAMLVDLAETVPPTLTIVDAVESMEGNGPSGGTAKFTGRIFGGEDVWTIDLFAAHLMGMPVPSAPTVAEAVRRGLCAAAFAPSMVEGPEELKKPVAGFRHPSAAKGGGLSWASPLVARFAAPRPKVNTKKCIGCGQCAAICPAHTIRVEKGKAHIYQADCIKCFCCHEICPVKAIDVKHIPLFNL